MVGISYFYSSGIGIVAFSQHPDWFRGYNTKAVTNTAQVNLQPSKVTAIPSTTLQLWITTSAATGFVAVEIDFTPTSIQLTSDVTLTSTTLTRVIKKTSYTEANSTGKIIFVLGLDPAQKANAPQGTMQLATLNFTAVTPASVGTTKISISGSASQVVGMDAAPMNITTSDTAVWLHIPGDVTGQTGIPDGVVNIFDWNAIVKMYGQKGTAGWVLADMVGETTAPDGVVDLYDLNVVVENYGKTQ
jgi:hypothetical protein